MKAPFLWLLLLAAASLPGQSSADKLPATYSLAQIERITLENNPELRAEAARVSVLEAKVPGAGALDDPSIMYRGWGVPFREPWNYNQAQNMFMVAQTFPGRGKRAARSEVAGLGVETAKFDFEATRRQLLMEARVAFYTLLRTRDEIRVYHEQASVARQAAEAARIKYTVGRVPQQDVLKAQIALTKLEVQLIEFQTEAQLASSRLNTLMGFPPDRAIDVMGDYALPMALPSMSELRLTAEQSRPELAAFDASRREAEARVRLARAAYSPDVTVSAGYMLMPAGSTFRNNYMVEAGINIPWLNRRRQDSEIASATAEQHAIDAGRKARINEIYREIAEAVYRAQAAGKLLALYRDTLRPQAHSTLKAAIAAYETDRTDFLNLLDSQNTSLEVEYSYYRALAAYDQRIAELERAIGAPILRAQSSTEVRP